MKLSRNDKRPKARARYEQPIYRTDAGRIGMLKRKLNFIQKEILATTHSGDCIAKGRLATEAVDLQSTIFRAESLVAR